MPIQTSADEQGKCSVCGQPTLHARDAADALLAKQCGFDLVGAMDKLLGAHHANHADPRRAQALFDAYMPLFSYRKLAGPELLSRIAILKAARTTIEAIENLGRAVEAARRDWEWSSYFSDIEASVAAGQPWLGRVRDLEERWGKDVEGRQLVRTGRPAKELLAEAEHILSQAGWAPIEIARLELDGESVRDGDSASDRVQKRLRTFEARRDDWPFGGEPEKSNA